MAIEYKTENGIRFYFDNEKTTYEDATVIFNIEETYMCRSAGLPSVLYPSGRCFWRYKHYHHRLNGPAHMLHRQAMKSLTASNWRVYGRTIAAEIYFEWLEKTGIDINNITPEDEILIAIEWNANNN